MSNIFTKHPLYLLVRCALPHCVSSMFFSIYYIVDGIFVGKFLGSEDLAVMGLIMPFVIISFALTDMIAIGSSVLISLLCLFPCTLFDRFANNWQILKSKGKRICEHFWAFCLLFLVMWS